MPEAEDKKEQRESSELDEIRVGKSLDPARQSAINWKLIPVV